MRIDNPKISACIITKDDPAVINAIKSVESSCFEIILVNTFPTENVKELVKDNLKVKYYYFKWCDNFSKARNYGINKATGDWIFTIDSDEVLEKRIEFVDDKYLAYQCNQQNAGINYTSSRLFQNKPEIRYRNRIHESIDYALTPENCCKSDIIIKHTGYDISEEEMKAKMKRNNDLMFKDKGNVIRNLHLGNYYFTEKKDYREALKYYMKATKDKLNDEHFALIWNNIHASKFMLGYHYKELIDALRKSLVYEPFQLYARANIVEHTLSVINETNYAEYRNIIEKELIKLQEISENNLSKLILRDVPIDLEFIKLKYSELEKFKMV